MALPRFEKLPTERRHRLIAAAARGLADKADLRVTASATAIPMSVDGPGVPSTAIRFEPHGAGVPLLLGAREVR